MTNTIRFYKLGEEVLINFILPIFGEQTKVRTRARIINIDRENVRVRVKLIENQIFIKGKLYEIRRDDNFQLDVEPKHLKKTYEASTQSYNELLNIKFTQ